MGLYEVPREDAQPPEEASRPVLELEIGALHLIRDILRRFVWRVSTQATISWLDTLPWIQAEVAAGPEILLPRLEIEIFGAPELFPTDALPREIDFEQVDPELSELALRGSFQGESFRIVGRLGGVVPIGELFRLAPVLELHEPGQQHTVTARIRDPFGQPLHGARVAFDVEAGPNAGALGLCSADPGCVTDESGAVSFTYTSLGASGVGRISTAARAEWADGHVLASTPRRSATLGYLGSREVP